MAPPFSYENQTKTDREKLPGAWERIAPTCIMPLKGEVLLRQTLFLLCQPKAGG